MAAVPTDGLEVVLLIDTSGSMNESAALHVGQGGGGRIPRRTPRGRAGWRGRVRRCTGSCQPTHDRPQCTSAALDQLRAGGETAMYDGIVFGDTLFSGGTTDRQFVLLSDGGDTASMATLDDTIAVTSRVRTNAIEIVTSESNSEAITSLAQAGSGRLTSVADPAGFRVLYQEVARSLVNRYRLSLTSQSSRRGTKFTVQISTPFGPVSGTTVVDLPVAQTPSTPPPVTQSAPVAPAADASQSECCLLPLRPRLPQRLVTTQAGRFSRSCSAPPPWVSDSRRCWSSC